MTVECHILDNNFSDISHPILFTRENDDRYYLDIEFYYKEMEKNKDIILTNGNTSRFGL